MGKIYRVKGTQGEIKYPVTVTDAVVDGDKILSERLKEIEKKADEGGVTGVKGSAETTFRKGDVTISAADLGLGNVTNESKEDILKDAALTGTPTAPTAATATNTTQVATTEFVQNVVKGLDVSDTAVAGKYVSKVTETDGKIAVTREDLPDYSITVTKKATANSGAAASYTIAQTKSGVSVDIDIPKDMVVSSGTVVTYTASNLPTGAGAPTAAGTYLVLTLANATSDKVYINVGSLIEYVTSGSAATDKIQIAVNASTHKVTASIKAGSIEKTDLDTNLQSAIDNANSAIQSVGSGSTNGTVSVDGQDVAVTGLGAAAYKGVATSVSTSTDLITAKAVKDAGYTTNTGTVTQVVAGNGLEGGTITTTGTISLPAITRGSTTGTGVTGTEGTTFTAVTGITTDSYGRVTSVEKTTLTNKYRTYAAATQSAAGLMSAADKTTLDTLDANAVVFELVPNSKEYDDDKILAAIPTA